MSKVVPTSTGDVGLPKPGPCSLGESGLSLLPEAVEKPHKHPRALCGTRGPSTVTLGHSRSPNPRREVGRQARCVTLSHRHDRYCLNSRYDAALRHLKRRATT